ncbi:MAG: hypothetical protein K0S53_1750 [Bacteroidetes bacterium]|jgi:ligand-binding sensor domain-containing protein|nr:hypothetical protein [Bacteroidota bacterium]MDF2450847.1 hypothetical protein [Bacteroidota bacterium]
MIHHRLQILVIILVAYSTICSGQLLPGQSIAGLTESKSITEGQPKIIKTQGTNQFANVHCGLQDKAGNLWFGTTGEGVYRYDGKTFTNFTEKDGLSNNNVWCIYEDKENHIWFGTGDGICRYNSSASSGNGLKSFFTLPITDSLDNTSAKNEVWSILQDKTGSFWFGTSNGVYQYDGKSLAPFLQNDKIINKNKLRLKHIQAILEDQDGNFWFASWNQEGACRFDGKTLTNFRPNEDGMVHAMLEDKNGNIWFGTRNKGVCVYDGQTFINFTEKESLRNTCVYSMSEDQSGNIWFATETTGIWYYNSSSLLIRGSKNFTNFTTENGLNHNSVFSITIDKAGNIWCGTRNTGLSRYDGKTFTNFFE